MSTKTHQLLKLIILLLGGLFLSSHSLDNFAGTKRALLIGVNHYPNLSKKWQLDGPYNDVNLLNNTLLKAGFNEKNIKLLTHKRASITKHQITDALEEIIRTTKKNDFIFLYFSGHGTQQPSKDTKEVDGADEIFLPSDTKRWYVHTKSVKNAIIDNEIEDYVNRLREKDAFVWLMIDSCHSGTMGKSICTINGKGRKICFIGNEAEAVQMRFIPAKELGIPSINKNIKIETPLSFKKIKLGGYVAFYASQSNQKTYEKNYGFFSDKKPYGLFTYELVDLLKNSQYLHLTYRQLAKKLHQRYFQLKKTKPTPTPLEVGDLDTCIFCPLNPIQSKATGTPFFSIKVAIDDKNKCAQRKKIIAIKKIFDSFAPIKIVSSANADIIVKINADSLSLYPTNPIFSKNKIALNHNDKKMSKRLLNYLYRFSIINAIFNTLNKNIHTKQRDIKFDVRIGNKKNSGQIQLQQGKIMDAYDGIPISIKIHNKAETAKDITMMLIDNQYSILPLFPADKNQTNRLLSRNRMTQEGIISSDTIGKEILLLFSSKVIPGQLVTNFKFLRTKSFLTINKIKALSHRKITMPNFLIQHNIMRTMQSPKNLDLYYVNWHIKPPK